MKNNNSGLIKLAVFLLAAIVVLSSVSLSGFIFYKYQALAGDYVLEVGKGYYLSGQLEQANRTLADILRERDAASADKSALVKSFLDDFARAVNREQQLREKNNQLASDNAGLVGVIQTKQSRILSLENELSVSQKKIAAKIRVQPVLFIPQGNEPSRQTIEKDVLAVARAMPVVQNWYLQKVGVTFAVSEPIVAKGKRTILDYEFPIGREQWAQTEIIFNELSDSLYTPPPTYYLVFLYGKTSATNWGLYDKSAVLAEFYLARLNSGSDWDKNTAMGVMAHELGHVFAGLPDVVSDNIAIMNHASTGVYATTYFPNVDFTENEKVILRQHMN